MRPGLPTWLLGLLVVAALGGSAWLFWSDWSNSDRTPTSRPDTAGTETAVDETNDELVLPDEDETGTGTDRDRLDSGTSGDRADDEDDGDAAGDALPAELPATYASLRDRRIALAPASALGTGDVKRLVSVEGLKVPCASPATDDDAIKLELSIASSTAALLDDASARVVGEAARGFGSATCVDARVKAFADTDVALVYRVDPTAKTARVIAGRATGTADRATTTLAAELAAALDLKSVTPATSAQLRTLLANAGAIDAPGGASVVLVELPTTAVQDEDARSETVDAIVGATAAWFARADADADADADAPAGDSSS